MPKDTIQEFLDRIAKIESSNNYNAQHPTMQSGMHRNMAAVGRYGMMPLTVAELLERKRQEDEQNSRQQPTESPTSFVGPEQETPTSQPESGEEELTGMYRFMIPGLNPKSKEYNEGANAAAQSLEQEPEAQDYLARRLAKQLLEKTGGDQDRAAYMWTMGHNLPNQRVTPEKMDSSDYVQKFRGLTAEDSDVPQLEEAPKPKRFLKTSKLLSQR